jgi:NNP family nitrate/nitrite transporter-like MFS transporter
MSVLTRGRWLDRWHPDNEQFWESEGKAIARKNLIFSVFAENIGFSIWVLWTIIVINLQNVGIQLTISQMFWLTAVPNLIGAALRIPYTFAVPRFGGRAWTMISASLLLIPVTLVATVVPSGWLQEQSADTQFWVLLACASTAGLGGGNFSSSMANISHFYPEGKKGLALGINAAGGNIGVAVTQLLVPLVIIIGVPSAAVKLPAHEVHLANAGLLWMPFIVLAAIGSYLFMDSITDAKADKQSYTRALSEKHTWIMSVLYIGTFGTFIGFSFAMPLIIKNTFPEFLGTHPFIATYLAGLAFVGAVVGSIARPFGGWLADRLGGARVTLAVFLGMVLATFSAIAGINGHSFTQFFGSFMVVFALSGIGNGSIYRMIPSVFKRLGHDEAYRTGSDHGAMQIEFRRRAAAVIGITGAIGAFGGFLIQVVLRQSSLEVSALIKAATTPAEKKAIALANTDWAVPAFWVFIGAYFVFALITWAFYVRTVAEHDASVVPTDLQPGADDASARELAGAL